MPATSDYTDISVLVYKVVATVCGKHSIWPNLSPVILEVEDNFQERFENVPVSRCTFEFHHHVAHYFRLISKLCDHNLRGVKNTLTNEKQNLPGYTLLEKL